MKKIKDSIKKSIFLTYSLKSWILIFILGNIIIFLAILLGLYPYLLKFFLFLQKKFYHIITLRSSFHVILASILIILGLFIAFYSLYKIYRYFQHFNEDLFNKTYFESKLSKGPKIITIGGGTGQYTCLYGLKNYTSNISAIVSTMDSGGSSQILKTEFGILPPGDLRNSIIALSTLNEKQTNIFKLRFDKTKLKGHPIGNLILTKLTEDLGLKEAIKQFSDLLRIRGKVLPITYDKCELIAKLHGNLEIKGEFNIGQKALGITDIYLTNKVKLNPDIKKAVEEADIIVLGPGDLFTSVIPNLLVEGFTDLINKSKAKKVYICNVFTNYPETHGFKAENYLEWIDKYVNLDYVIFNNKKPSKKIINNYLKENKIFVEPIFNNNKKFIKTNVINNKIIIRHDSDKLAKEIIKLKN